MSLFAWEARGRNVSGISTEALDTVFLPWSPDPTFAGHSLPWADPEYPVLLITGLGVDFTASAVVATRNILLTIDQPRGGRIEWVGSGNITAGVSVRVEFARGTSLFTPLADAIMREPLPAGFMLFPGDVGGFNEGQLTVSFTNPQVGDVLGPVSIRGVLLLP